MGIICPPYWNRVHQPKCGPRAPVFARPAIPCAGGEFNNLLRSIFEFSHFTRAFIWQTIFDPSLFVFFSHLFYCYLSFQKFVKALLMLRTIKSNILLTESNNLFRNANPNFHEFSDQSELVLQTEIRKNSRAVPSFEIGFWIRLTRHLTFQL